MSDRVKAEIVKWALWTGTAGAALVMVQWPVGYPLRPWKWRDYERHVAAERKEFNRRLNEAIWPE